MTNQTSKLKLFLWIYYLSLNIKIFRNVEEGIKQSEEMGFPVMIKASECKV